MEFLDNIMEFLWSFLYHIVESVWSLEIRIQNFDTTMWSFHGVSLPDSGVFMEFHYQIVEFFFLTLTPLNGIFLEFCWCVKNIEIRIYREICNSMEQQT